MLHHAYVDGVGASYGLEHLYRDTPGYQHEPAPPWAPRPAPSWGKRLWLGIVDWPSGIMKNIPKVVQGLRQKKALEKKYDQQGKPAHPLPA